MLEQYILLLPPSLPLREESHDFVPRGNVPFTALAFFAFPWKQIHVSKRQQFFNAFYVFGLLLCLSVCLSVIFVNEISPTSRPARKLKFGTHAHFRRRYDIISEN